jgi:hypothetical protein
MQMVGFAMLAITFGICGGLYDQLLADAPDALRFLYFCSSFFNQFGPNCTSFLCAAESFPTAVRAKAHGASAAAGKLGALVATIVFASLTPKEIFIACAGVGAAGAALTFFLLPETTGLDMAEADRFYLYLTSGEAERYTGEAVNPRHFSPVERWCGHGKHYDAAADADQRRLQALAAKKRA